MRFAVLFFAVLAGVAAFFLLGGSSSLSPSTEPETPIAPIDMEPAASAPTGGPAELPQALPEMISEPEDLGEDEEPGRSDATSFSGRDLVEFHGSALLQPKGQRPYSAVRGTIEIAILNNGRLVPMSVEVNQGKFSVELPDRCRVRIQGGQLEDQAVRFFGSEVPFTLDAEQDYAMVGEPIPVNRLLVFEGTQRIPLANVTVRTGTDGVTARMQGAAPVGDVLVADAASPIDLPYLAAKHPVWLHVSAEGYATTALLLDPQKANKKEVVLWPSATLTVRVTGPARTRLKALTLHRHEPLAGGQNPTKRHFATLDVNSPGITTDADATIFQLENIPALLLTVEARGFDKRGRDTLLGTTSVELGTDQAGLVTLRLEGK